MLGRESFKVDIIDAFLISGCHVNAIDSNHCAPNTKFLLERLYLSADRATYNLEACDVGLLTNLHSYGAVLGLEDLVLLLS